MARIAFIMDRIFRKFGLSGKSFIPMLIGTGCGVPGVMASRTIENERDRRMTIMTTTFIPCGAKMPIIGHDRRRSVRRLRWVATSAYFIGMAAIIISGIMLKKTKMFAGDPAPFVMELPATTSRRRQRAARHVGARLVLHQEGRHHHPAFHHLRVVHLQGFGFDGTASGWSEDQDNSILAKIGNAIAGSSRRWAGATGRRPSLPSPAWSPRRTSSVRFGVLYCGERRTARVYDAIAAFTGITGYTFLVFNLLCAPCFAAIGAIKREMNNAKWTWFAIGYQCGFAYADRPDDQPVRRPVHRQRQHHRRDRASSCSRSSSTCWYAPIRRPPS